MSKFRPPRSIELIEIHHTPQIQKLINSGKMPPCQRFKAGLTYLTVFPPFDNGKLKRGLYIDLYRKDRFLTEDEIKRWCAPFMDKDSKSKFTVESKQEDKFYRTVVEEKLPDPVSE